MGAEGAARLRVKICGLRRREDVLAADAAGADYVGVILSAGFARSVSLAAAAGLVDGVRATPVAVLVDEPAEEAAVRADALGARVLQLHGSEPEDVVRELSTAGRWTLWKSVRARTGDDVDRAVDRYGAWVGGLLVEGWRDGVVGGGGVSLDPERFADLRARVPVGLDVILAGGLDPDNVAGAVARFGPDVVDVSSGVETSPGRKDHELVRLFVRYARAAAGEAAAGEDAQAPPSRREPPQ
jgi:phosphoribosylanthranilate isomerase